jgi:hypothetical protein
LNSLPNGQRKGFFKVFKNQEIIVREWDALSEDLFPEDHMSLDQQDCYRFSKFSLK